MGISPTATFDATHQRCRCSVSVAILDLI